MLHILMCCSVALGIVFMIYSFFYSREIYALVSNGSRNNWLMISFFIFSFQVAYSVYFFILISGGEVFFKMDKELLVSMILFFGSIFVVLSLKTSHQALSGMNKNKKEVEKLNEFLKKEKGLLEEDEREILKKKSEVEAVEKKLEKRNKELEKTLNDFYAFRLGMAKESEKSRIDEENSYIKNRLDEMKK